jgi:hypothetical protein
MAIDKITTASITDANITTAKIASGVLPTNAPAFHATNSAVQDLNSATYTKVAYNTETYDEGGVFNNSTYRFTPGETGKFFIYYRLGLITSTSAQNKYPYIEFGRLYKNGSQLDFGALLKNSNNDNYNYQEVYLNASGVVNVTSANDYFELFAYSTNVAGAADTDVNTGSYFGAYKIII